MAEILALVPMAAAGLATALGAVPILAVRRLSHRSHDTFLGFAAGIMLAVAAIDLLPEATAQDGFEPAPAILSVLLGAAVILALTRTLRRLPLPMPFVGDGRGPPSAAFLIFLALAIHNAPEGLATGLGYAQGLTPAGHGIAIAIALQNVPEGLLVAVPILAETGSRKAAFGSAVLSGLVEPFAGIVALLFVAVSPAALGTAFGFATGAMLAVVIVQMIPESHRHGHGAPACAALAIGAILVALLHVFVMPGSG